MIKWIAIASVMLSVFTFVAVTLTVHAQPARLTWVREDCTLADCVTRFLNSLPPERAAEAKVGVARSGFPPYMVWYRK